MKQGVVDALAKDNRLLNETLPLRFFEKDQRRLSFKGASKASDGCGFPVSYRSIGWGLARPSIINDDDDDDDNDILSSPDSKHQITETLLDSVCQAVPALEVRAAANGRLIDRDDCD